MAKRKRNNFSVRDDKMIRKLAAYVVLGINQDGYKEVLGLYIGQNESSKYWLGILNELKNRGVKDILIICADGLSGIKESISVAFPETEYQRCIVHHVRNTLKYVSYKDRKEYAKDLKAISLVILQLSIETFSFLATTMCQSHYG